MESEEEGAPDSQSFQRRRNASPDPATEEFSAASADAQQETVSEFDYSVENHFEYVDKMNKLCGFRGTLEADPAIKRFSNSLNFLREWKDFDNNPRVVKLACQKNSEEKDVIGGITLSQFAAAFVPKVRNVREKLIRHLNQASLYSGRNFR